MRNPSWVIDLKSFIMRWKGQCKRILFLAIDVLLIDVLLTVVFYIIIQIYRDWT